MLGCTRSHPRPSHGVAIEVPVAATLGDNREVSRWRARRSVSSGNAQRGAQHNWSAHRTTTAWISTWEITPANSRHNRVTVGAASKASGLFIVDIADFPSCFPQCGDNYHVGNQPNVRSVTLVGSTVVGQRTAMRFHLWGSDSSATSVQRHPPASLGPGSKVPILSPRREL